MPITTIKNSMLFPEVGQIRKGAPKQPNLPGKDLNEKFRVVFFPGNAETAAEFIKNNGSLNPTRIKAMLPFPSLDACWQVYNEAYSAGRMLARADGDHFIMLRDGKTGEYIVQDGKPFMEYHPGMTVDYVASNNKRMTIQIKPYGRLYVFLPELGRAVFLTLKTTSFYDALNIERQLAAIEAMGKTLNGGSVAGIGIEIYRRPQQITWNKPDGSAVRIEKWLINVEVTTEWMRSAAARMSRFALGGFENLALPEHIAGTVDPEQDEGDLGDTDEPQEGEFEDVAPTEQPKTKTPAPAAKSNGRPIAPELLRNTIADKAALITDAKENKGGIAKIQNALTYAMGEIKVRGTEVYETLVKHLIGVDYLSELSPAMTASALGWLALDKDGVPSDMALKEIEQWWDAYGPALLANDDDPSKQPALI